MYGRADGKRKPFKVMLYMRVDCIQYKGPNINYLAIERKIPSFDLPMLRSYNTLKNDRRVDKRQKTEQKVCL